MKMETKFRTWSPKTNEMLEGIHWYVAGIDKAWLDAPEGILNSTFEGKRLFHQYIGLEDNTGERIYYGDVLRFDNGDTFYIDCEEWVEFFGHWIGEPQCEDQLRDFYRIRNAEIIGNIYQHPELLITDNQ